VQTASLAPTAFKPDFDFLAILGYLVTNTLTFTHLAIIGAGTHSAISPFCGGVVHSGQAFTIMGWREGVAAVIGNVLLQEKDHAMAR